MEEKTLGDSDPLMEPLLCRLCAVACDTCISLLDPVNEHLARWVVTYVNIQIKKPNCPCHICEKCSSFISSCIEFVSKSRKTQQVFILPVKSVRNKIRDSLVLKPSDSPCQNESRTCHIPGSLKLNMSHSDGYSRKHFKHDSKRISLLKTRAQNRDVSSVSEQDPNNSTETRDKLKNHPETPVSIRSKTGDSLIPKLRDSPCQNKSESSELCPISRSIKLNMSHGDVNSRKHLKYKNKLSLLKVKAQNPEVASEQDPRSATDTKDKLRNFPETPVSIESVPEFIDYIKQERQDQDVEDLPQFVLSNETNEEALLEQNNADMSASSSLEWTPDTEHSVFIKCEAFPDEETSFIDAENVDTAGMSSSQSECCEIGYVKSHDVSVTHKPIVREYSPTNICNQTFPVKSVLKKYGHSDVTGPHFQKTPSRPFMCPHCYTTFVHKANMSWHMEYCKTGKQLPIKSYKNAENKLIHQCIVCSMEFKQIGDIRRHVREQHSNNKLYECEVCNKTFKSAQTLLNHNKVHQSSVFNCTICDAKFILQTDLAHHMEITHNSLNTTLFYCPKCSATFKHKNFLCQHLKCVHAIAEWECETCGKVFKCKKYLHRHKRDSHFELIFECSECSHTANTKTLLKMHIDQVHGSQAWTCKICGVIFKCEEFLERHVQHTHNNAFKCSDCNYITHSKFLLQLHMGQVHAIKQFMCGICGVAFKCKENLQNHVQYGHINKKIPMW